MKTLLLGLDAASWNYLEPLLSAGCLPTLQHLINSGVHGTMQSTIPAKTPTAWASIITGKNPGKHGIFDMVWRSPSTYDFVPTSARVRIGTPFWKYLNDKGIRVGLVNIPFTYPPESLDGFCVAGFGTPDSARNITYPADLLEVIETKWGRFNPVVDMQVISRGSPEQIFEIEQAHQSLQVQVATVLAKQFEVDVLAINLMLLDHANHKMPEMHQVNQAIIQCDADIAHLIQEFQPDHVLLFSDHGSRRSKGNFLINRWLIDQGYLIHMERNGYQRSQALNWILMQWLRTHWGWSGLAERLTRRLLRFTVPLLRGKLKQRFWQALNEVIPFAQEHILFSDQIDFSRTYLFPGSIFSGLLYFNISGRDPKGVLPLDKVAELSSEITDKLAKITDPVTGKPLSILAYSSKDLYNGSAGTYGPDLILDNYRLDWNLQLSYITPIVEKAYERYFVNNRGEFGWHRQDGIYTFSGPFFKPCETPSDGHVMDIPATLLYLYGVALPEDYDGRVLTGLFTSEFRDQNPITYQAGDAISEYTAENHLSAQEMEELTNHLRSLGYLE